MILTKNPRSMVLIIFLILIITVGKIILIPTFSETQQTGYIETRVICGRDFVTQSLNVCELAEIFAM